MVYTGNIDPLIQGCGGGGGAQDFGVGHGDPLAVNSGAREDPMWASLWDERELCGLIHSLFKEERECVIVGITP